MNKQTKIRILAKKLDVFVNKKFKIFDTSDPLTRVLYKHCADEDSLLEYLESISAGKEDFKFKDIKRKKIELTDKDLACIYSKTHIPMDHQIEYFQIARDQEFFANFSEMGLGKTLMILMEAGYLYEEGKIDSLIIIAPNGVHRQWVNSSVPEHVPDRLNPITAIWSSNDTKEEKFKLNYLSIPGTKGLKILSVNVESLGTLSKRSFEYLDAFMDHHTCMLAIDESTRIKNPKAKRTKLIMKLKSRAKYRRILSGLYIPNGPLDLFSQFMFLHEKILGFKSYVSFRSRYAVETNPMLKRGLEVVIGNKVVAEQVYNERRRRFIDPSRLKHLLGEKYITKFAETWKQLKKSFLIVQGYKNVEELNGKIEKYSFRVLKDDCLDLAPKTYMNYESFLSPEQLRIYSELERELITQINGEEVVADHVLKKLGILRQVCGGTFKDSEGKSQVIQGKIPRLDLLIETLNDIDLSRDKVIIWAVHRAEVEMIRKQVEKEFGKHSYAQIHGDIKGAAREEEFRKFDEDEECRILVGTQTSGGIGRNLVAGNYMIFYSNNHDLEVRRQAEDREHRKGQVKKVIIIDFITKGLIDELTLKSLLSKQKLADRITKDPMCWNLRLK